MQSTRRILLSLTLQEINQSVHPSLTSMLESIVNKTSSFHDYIGDMSPTICALVETWLPNDETDLRYKKVPPKGYDIISRPHPTTKKGGGVAVIYKSNLRCQSAPPTTNISEVMEHLDLTMNFKGLVVNLYVIYHFPNTSVIHFCDELSDLLEENIVSDHGVLLLTCGFNIHMDNLQNPDTIIFSDFLELFGLINFVGFPTHQSPHMLDLFIHTSIQHY